MKGRNNALYLTTAPVSVTVYPVSNNEEIAKQKQKITKEELTIFLLPDLFLVIPSFTDRKIINPVKIKFSAIAGRYARLPVSVK